MGHYRAEMMCEDCGETRCVCTRKPSVDPDLDLWLIADYKVMRVRDFDLEMEKLLQQRAAHVRFVPMLYRVGMPLYETKKEAKKALAPLIAAKLEEIKKLELKLLAKLRELE